MAEPENNVVGIADSGKIPINFPLGDKLIDGVVIKPLSFKMFTDCIVDAQSMKEPATFDGKIRRLRMHRQLTFYTNGSTLPVSMEDVLKLPIPAARLITGKLDDDPSVAGKIIREGDGIDKSIVYQLGTPIPVGQGKEPIKELEFHAQTYGDIEDVMAAPDAMSQTQQLIATIAKPLGTTLQLLPSWALAYITVADGIMISREVLPHFIESPPES